MLLNTAQVVIDRPNLWVAHCGHLCVAYARGETDAALIGDLNRGFKILAKRVPTGIGLLLLIGEGSPAPTGEVRESAVQMFNGFGADLKMLAVYIEGSGFVAAAKRSVNTLLVSRIVSGPPVQVYGQVEQATTWLEQRALELHVESPSSEELQLLINRSNTRSLIPVTAIPVAVTSRMPVMRRMPELVRLFCWPARDG